MPRGSLEEFRRTEVLAIRISSSYKQRLSSLGGSSPSGAAHNIIETVLALYGHLPLPQIVEAMTRDANRSRAFPSPKTHHDAHIRATLKLVSKGSGATEASAHRPITGD